MFIGSPGITGWVWVGLPIVKRIVAAHGGNIGVASQLDVGTSFSISLPIAEDGVALPRIRREGLCILLPGEGSGAPANGGKTSQR